MTEWLIASNNPAKTADLQLCLAHAKLNALKYTDIFARVDFPDEGLTSYQTNALHKAQFLARKLNRPVIADDSGLELQALKSAFGVTTNREVKAIGQKTRQSDNEVILALLAGNELRTARMITSLVAAWPDGSVVTGQGQVSGTIALMPCGNYSKGFDKIFQPNGWSVTLAQLPDSKRLGLTHRGRAALDLANNLKKSGKENA